MLQNCPCCHQSIPLEVMNIIDEQIVVCPYCSHQYKIYLDPKVKQILEITNREMLQYMMDYPKHHSNQNVMEEMPSGMMNTFQ